MDAVKYPKIQTVWLRDPATKYKTLLEGEWAKPEFRYLADAEWDWTEKIDGTNIRVAWDNHAETVTIGGRTEKSQIHAVLVEHLHANLPEQLWRTEFPDASMCLYGEGYGARIQKAGGDYIPDGVSFILFDVMCGGVWLQRGDVEDIASTFGIEVVPIRGRGPLAGAIDMARQGFASEIGNAKAEGLVMRPPVDLFNRSGERVICKIKTKDF